MLGQSLSIFHKQLDKLTSHLNLLIKVKDVNDSVDKSADIPPELAKQVKEVLEKDTDERIFDYNANVISLYGFWETFIESIIKEYIKKLRAFGTGSDSRNINIAPRFRENVIGLFRKVNTNNPKFRHLTEKKLIDSLYVACSQEKNDYLPEAFFQSGGNYNYAEMSDCLKRLGFSNVNDELKLYPSFARYCTSQGYSEEQIRQSELSALCSKLDILVTMRNEIAHSSIEGTQIIGPANLKEYVVFMQHLSCAINEYLSDDLRSIVWSQLQSVDMEVRHYLDRLDVSELRSQPVRIEVGKPVMFYDDKSYPHYGYQKVVSLFVDDKEYTSDVFETATGTEKLTLTFDRKGRKGLRVKFNANGK